MSLRLQINLVLAFVIAFFVAALLVFQILDTRDSVHEETTAANTVATHLMREIATLYAQSSLPVVETSLQRLGHVRSTEITLRDLDGHVLYRSPPPTYKAGRFAPAWYAHLVQPAPMRSEMEFYDSTLTIDANASRAVLDGWDDTVTLAKVGVATLLAGNLLVFWLAGRAMKPFRTIVKGLQGMESGDYRTRLPDFRVSEARTIAHAFNRAAQSIEDNLDARREATEATLRAEHSRDLAAAVRERIEDERRQIARELHDETSQSITAIHSMALALARGGDGTDVKESETARLIADTAGRLYAAVHDLIPRLDAPELDELDLPETLGSRIAGWRHEHPDVAIDVRLSLPAEPLGGTCALAAYRIVQEAVSNALRHAGATRVVIAIDSTPTELHIIVRDDGRGLAAEWQRPGHFGVAGMRERAEALGGTLAVESPAEGGVRVSAILPLA